MKRRFKIACRQNSVAGQKNVDAEADAIWSKHKHQVIGAFSGLVMEKSPYVELVLNPSKPGVGESRHVRIFAPNTLELDALKMKIDEIALSPTAGLVFEDENGTAIGWMMPGERMAESDINEMHASRAHVIRLAPPRVDPTIAA